MLGAVTLVILGFAAGRIDRPTNVVETPIILEQVRALGDLHLVEHRYHTVLNIDSHRDAAEWTQQVPVVRNVATGIVQAATRNRGVATVRGTVEAGIDMSKARIERNGEKLAIVLPDPEIYKPNVEAVIEHQRSAIAWDDRNLSLKAERRGADQFAQASRKAGILEQARNNGIRQVRDIFAQAGQKNVQVRFESDLN